MSRLDHAVWPAGLAAVALIGVAGANAIFVVPQSQTALVVRLGQAVRFYNANGDGEGLHLKWPGLDRVVRFDRRERVVESPPQTDQTGDGRALMVSAAFRYQITDPPRFYQAMNTSGGGDTRLQDMAEQSVRAVMARTSRQAAVAGDRTVADAMLAEARADAERERLGVQVQDADLVSVAPTSDEVASVTRRMQANATVQAAEVRTEGEQHRRELIAAADREAADVRGDGERQALETRGDGDAQRTAILGVAYGQDPGFARFFRRLEAYDQALSADTTTLVLSPDNAFLDLFGHGPTGSAPPPMH